MGKNGCKFLFLLIDNFEQKFNLPDDVDAGRLTSGISRDGILMIRFYLTNYSLSAYLYKSID